MLQLLLLKYTFYVNNKNSILYCAIKIFFLIVICTIQSFIYNNNIYNLICFMYFLFRTTVIYLCFSWKNILYNFDFRFLFKIKMSQIYCVICAIEVSAIQDFIFVINFCINLFKSISINAVLIFICKIFVNIV